jgi:hypothetical protein
MITSRAFTTKIPLKINPEEQHSGLSSLFAAAVVSRSFCDILLRDPEKALRQGYMGKDFGLSQADASLIVSLNARSLADLAQQVVKTLGQ